MSFGGVELAADPFTWAMQAGARSRKTIKRKPIRAILNETSLVGEFRASLCQLLKNLVAGN